MKVILVFVLLFVSIQSSDFFQFLLGFAEGVESGIGDLEVCVKDVRTLISHYTQSFNSFRGAINDKSEGEMKEGFIQLAEALIDTYHAYEDCGVKKLIDEIEKVYAELQSGQFIEIALKETWYILWHGFELYDEVKDCVHSYESRNYNRMGFDMGKLTQSLIGAAEA